MNQDYSAEFKAKAVLRVWTGNRSCDVVANELGVSAADLARWVEQAERTAPEVFRAKKDRQNGGLIKQLSKERERLTMEVQWLRGKLAMVAPGADVSALPSDPGEGRAVDSPLRSESP